MTPIKDASLGALHTAQGLVAEAFPRPLKCSLRAVAMPEALGLGLQAWPGPCLLKLTSLLSCAWDRQPGASGMDRQGHVTLSQRLA